MKKILALLILVPSALSAQTRTMVSGYLATDPGVAGNPLLVGFTAARETGPMAARLSLGFDVSGPAQRMEQEESLAPLISGVWSTDADALLFLGNPRGSAALVPYGIAGVGVRGITDDGRLGVEPNYSYGAGFRAPLGAGFSMEGEGRYRNSFSEPAVGSVPRVNSGMEFRFGVSVGFGGGPRINAVPASSPPRTISPSPLPTGVLPRASILASVDSRTRVAAATLNTASNYLGVPYVWGGNNPQEGFDCSGFIRYVFNLNGITVPRVSQDQARFGSPVPLEISQFQPGDILAFSSTGGAVDHTALYVGNGRIIHSSSSGSGVRYDDLYSSRGEWYRNHMVAARRVIDGGIFLSAR